MKLLAFFRKEFVKNVLTLIKGNAFSQIIIYATIPILTRLFSEELFGVYMLFSSVILLLKPLFSLQYELAILLPKRDKDAANFVVFTILLLIFSSSLLFIILYFFSHDILTFFNIQSLENFLYLIPVSTFLLGTITTLEYWSNRKTNFKNIYFGLVTKSSVMSSSQIATGLSFFKSLGLIPGLLLGQLSQLVILSYKTFKEILQHKKEISINRMLFLAKKYRDIPIFNSTLNFTNTLSNELPVLLISKYFGLANAGIYGLAVKVGKAPVGIIQQSISQVFYNKASKTFQLEGDLNIVVQKTVRHLLLIGVATFIPLFTVSFFLDYIFGEDWSEVGLYIRILLPWLFMMFLSSPLTSLIVVLNKQRPILVYDIFLLLSRFLAFYIGYTYYDSILVALGLFSAVGVIFNIFILIFFLRISSSKQSVYN